MIVAMESSKCVTIEVSANGRGFIGSVPAVIRSIAQIRLRHTQVVTALESIMEITIL